MTDLFGVAGTELLESLPSRPRPTARASSRSATSSRSSTNEIAMLERDLRHQLRRPAWLRGAVQADPRDRAALRGGVRGRDRRRHPLQVSWHSSGELGGPHAEAPRVGPHGPPRADYQTGLTASCAGRRSKRPNDRRQGPSCGPTFSASPLITATPSVPARSPASPWRERSSPSSSTAFGTAPSVPRPSSRRRDAHRTPTGRVVAKWVMAPGLPAWPRELIDPAWLVAATLHADIRRRNDRQARPRLCPPEARFGLWRRQPGVPSVRTTRH
jgi:hypothetical protein